MVSVIIATYNCAAVLRLTLQALLRQELRDFEVLVVGDACTDDTAQVVESLNDARLRWIALPVNSGSQSAPNNAGMRAARGRYIAFLGHDDLLFPWHLRRLVEHIESTQSDFVHGLCAMIHPDGIAGGIGASPPDKDYDEHFVPPSTWLFRREMRESVGDWRAPHELQWPIDFDWTRRAFQKGHKMSFAPFVGVLKFPSPEWKTYALQGAPPQETFAREMREAPHELCARVTFELASLGAQQWARRYYSLPGAAAPSPFGTRLRHFVVRRLTEMSQRAMLFYGIERWPIRELRQRRFQKYRVNNLARQRGLVPPNSNITPPK